MVDYWRQRADPDGAADAAERAADVVSWHASSTLDGTVVVNGTLDPISGAIYTDELDRLTELLRLADERDGVVRTAAQRRAAAQVEMAIRSASMPPGAQRPRPLFIALIGDDTVAHLCQLANGRVITPARPRPVPRRRRPAKSSCSTDRPPSCRSPRRDRSPAPCVGPSRSATGTANTPPAATSPPPAATSTTSCRGPSRQRTDQFNGRLAVPHPQPSTPTVTTTTPNHSPTATSATSTPSAPASAGNTSTTHPTTPTTPTLAGLGEPQSE